MKKLSILSVMFVCVFLFNLQGFAQPDEEIEALKEEIKEIKEGQKAIRKDLQEIKNLLRPRRAPVFKEAIISIERDPFKGDKKAELALIEFSEYQCPFCGRHVRETFPQIEKEYILTGKMKYIFKDFPLESIHKSAFKLAEAANCADEQGKFWEMHDRFFADKKAVDLEALSDHARAIGLDVGAFNECLDGGKYSFEIKKDMAEASNAGIRSTPTFLLGFTQPDGKVKAVKMIRGAQPYHMFQQAIENLLKSEKQ